MSGLLIAVTNGNGEIIQSQPYQEFVNGPRNLEILNVYLGSKLLSILVDDLNIISFNDNKFVLKTILENSNITTMKLLGKVAEAVVVRRCRENLENNLTWLSIARKKSARVKTATKYIAYGTGLVDTQKKYPQKYNYSDPQRDIIWIGNQGKLALMKGSTTTSGLVAGIQIKVSRNGGAYILDDLIQNRYEVPLVYFDICNDFDNIANKLYKKGKGQIVGYDFVQAKAIDYDAYSEVAYYEDLVRAIVTGKLTIEDLAYRNEYPVKSAIMSAAFSTVNLTNLIV